VKPLRGGARCTRGTRPWAGASHAARGLPACPPHGPGCWRAAQGCAGFWFVSARPHYSAGALARCCILSEGCPGGSRSGVMIDWGKHVCPSIATLWADTAHLDHNFGCIKYTKQPCKNCIATGLDKLSLRETDTCWKQAWQHSWKAVVTCNCPCQKSFKQQQGMAGKVGR
jgi:hypothetical protein